MTYLENFLKISFCKKLIGIAESIGFEESKVNMYGIQKLNKSIRNNSRCFWENEDLADELSEASLYNIDSFFRFYKYEVGQYFKPHKDGLVTKNGKESTHTMLVYLNDCKDAGTVIMPYGPSQPWAFKDYECSTGSVLILDQNMWHAGKEVKSGVKYVLRADIFGLKK